ncbi:MAG: porin [Opitutae bacterium]|nr:porin [Opitutae bacterium]
MTPRPAPAAKRALRALAALALFGAAVSAQAQDAKAIVDALVRKGILTTAEAAQITAEAAKSKPAPDVATSGGKFVQGLSLSGRLQVQFAGLATDISGTAADPAATQHFFLRRIYLGAKANLGHGWTSSLNYDFAGSTFDEAKITWTQSDALSLDFGFRKVPFGIEEWFTSSGSLKAIERSPGTRYFVEGNNGRRLGAGSYRIGVYAGGKNTRGLFYNVAITNPEREESSAGVAGSGSAANNNFAYWGNLGFKGKAGASLTYVVSASVGWLPDQGGKTLGAGDDLRVFNAFADFTSGAFDLQLEYFGSDNEHGRSATKNSRSSAFSVQPAFKAGKNLEYVLRYSRVDSDGRGVNLSDGIRSAPGGGTMDRLTEWYLGLSYFFRGNDVKWQAGCLLGESRDTVTGGPAKARTQGVRSQLQLNF